MINFIDEKGVKHSAVVECKKTKGVNGEKSLSGTIYTNNEILEGIGRGWRLEFENEKYCLTYVYPIDEGNRIVVEFDAVHEFFFDLNKKVVYTELNGSNTAKAYLDIIFNGSGYSYLIEVNIPAFEKEGFGMRNRLDLFKEFVSDTGVEFSVNGKVVRILEKVGSNLSTIVKKGFNLNELRIEKDPSSFITYKKGFGAWVDEDDHSKGRLEVEYLSPLASIYGKLEGDPIVDERYKVASNFETRLKNDVESSYGISVDIDMEDLTKAGYEYEQPHEGDYIMAINKDLGFEQKIRIMSYETSYDTNGNIIDHKVSCGSDNIIRKSIKEDDDFRKEIQAGLEGAISTSNKAWVSANGKNAVFEGPNEPTATAIGDIWWQIDGEEKKMRIWNGYEWKPVFNPGEIENKIDQAEKNIAQNIVDIESALDKATQAELDAGFSKDLAEEAKALGVTASSLAGEATTNANTAMADAQEAIRQVLLNEGVVEDASAEATEARRLASLAEDNAQEAKTNANTAMTDAQEALTKANTSVTDASTALTNATKAFNKSIKSSAVAYTTSTNGSTPPTTGWGTTIPTPSPDVYIWTRTTIVLNDNTPVVSYSVGKIGAKGDQGLKGDTGGQGIQGIPGVNAPTIKSVVQQFYLSTSKTSQTGGSWLATVPVWSSGKYYWVRVATTYSNNATTTSTPVLDNALNDSLITALEVKTANQNLSTTVTQHSTLIEGKANSTTVDAIDGRVTTAEGSISTIAGQVALKASATDVNALTGRVSTAEGNITTQAGQIALKADTKDVNALTGRVSTAEGKITTQAGQIELKASTKDVNALTGRVTTAEGNITTQAGQIALRATTATVNALTSRVSAAEASLVVQSGKIDLAATKTELTTAIDDIEIGGRNLLLNSKTLLTSRTNEVISFLGREGVVKVSNPANAMYINPREKLSDEVSSEDEYVLSVDFTYVGAKGPTPQFYIGGYQPVEGVIEEGRFNRIYIRAKRKARIHMHFGGFEEIYLHGWKLEKGNKATAWTPAPEDVDAAISTVQSNLTTEAGKITALTTRVSGSETNISNVTQTVSGINTTISTLRTDVNGKATTVALNAVKSTADGNKTTISNHSGRLTTVETTVSGLKTSVSNKADKTTVTQLADSVELKATKTNVTALTGRVSTAEGKITTQAGQIDLKANATDVNALTGRVSTAEGQISAQAGQIALRATKTEAQDYAIFATKNSGRWSISYRVNTATPMNLVEADGTPLSDEYSYMVSGVIRGTGTTTGAVALFVTNRVGTNGSGWTMHVLSEKGKGSNHIEFFIASNGRPSVRLYNHTSFYVVNVTHTKTYGNIDVNKLLKDSISTVQSNLTVEAGKITALTTKTNGHTTQIGQLQTSYNGLNSTVTQVRDDLDGMEIGGRNLYLDSGREITSSGYTMATYKLASKPIAGEKYTISIKGKINPGYHTGFFTNMYTNPNYGSYVDMITVGPEDLGSDGVYRKTFTMPTLSDYIATRLYSYPLGKNVEASVEWIKLEKGTKATDWSPAPEDYTTVTAFSTLEQNLSGFKTTVQNTYADKTTVQNTYATKTTVSQLAGQWQTTTELANGHTSQISSLGTAVNLRATKTEVDAKILSDKKIKDTRTTNQLPPWYYTNYPSQKAYEFKTCSTIGLPTSAGTYASLVTEVPWSDSSGGPVEQIATARDGVYRRRGSTTWSVWAKVADSSNIISQINVSPESILIASKKIQIKGDTYIDNGVIKTAHIADLSVSGAKIANATISSAKIVSLDASKITANTLSAITANTGNLNVSGDLTMTNDNTRIIGSFNYTEGANDAYRPRAFVGDSFLGRRFLGFTGTVRYFGNLSAYGYAETFYGLDYYKQRIYDSKASNVLKSRIDMYDGVIELSQAWALGSGTSTTITNTHIQSPQLYATSNVMTGRIVPISTWTTFQINEDLVGGIPRLVLSSGVGGFSIESNNTAMAVMNVGRDSKPRVWFNRGVYDRTYSAAANMHVTDAGTIGRAVSARKYKTDIQSEHLSKAKTVLQISPSSWHDKEALRKGKEPKRYYGFIADDFDELGLTEVVQYGADGQVEGLAYDRISMYYNVILQDHEQQLKRLDSINTNVIKLVANTSTYGTRLNNLESEVFRLKKCIEELEKIA